MNHLRTFSLALAAAASTLLGACHTNIVPMKPLVRITEEAPATPATTAPATQAATTESATTESATTQTATTESATTQPTTLAAATRPAPVLRVIDPNQTTRFIYKASYDNIWQQAMHVLTQAGFSLDQRNYRLGVLTTHPLPSAQIIEFWKPQQVNVKDSLENTINSQQRTVKVTISPVPGKPDFYNIGMQVIVERQTNPTEVIGGPVFVTGSAFGRDAVALRSDYVPTGEGNRWIVLGHDPDFEKKLLKALFQRI